MLEQILQLAAVYSAAAIALTEFFKRVLKASGVGSVVISIVSSLVVCVPTLPSEGFLTYFGVSVVVALMINGIFKAVKSASGGG